MVKSAAALRFGEFLSLIWPGCFGVCSIAAGQFAEAPPIVQEKCGVCHLVPSPFEIHRAAWPATIQSMVPFMAEKLLPLAGPDLKAIENYYVSGSKEKLFVIPDDLAETGIPFQVQSVGELKVHARPQITSVKIADVDGDGKAREIMVTDNVNQTVSWLSHDGTAWRERILTKGKSPVNTTPVDVDGDGDTDFAVCLMGDINPNEDLIGEFHLLINEGNGDYSTRVILPGGVARITDCAPGDFDGDGDIDFILAMFGWRKTGGFKILEQVAPLQFVLRDLVDTSGAMRVIPADLDGDGRLDFLALVSQEHETIVRFINEGGLQFRQEIILRSSPSFGTSSIYLEDLDQDGDLDILFTNGDMMDESPGPKPFHGVRWLENDGGNYQLRDLARMPGCYDAKPCDLDGDGDLDIVYSSLYFQWQDQDFPSLAWLENLGGFRTFIARKIAYAPANLANIAVGDLNGDGKIDIIGGGLHKPGPVERVGRLTLWLQQ